jgi:hypothetical protein
MTAPLSLPPQWKSTCARELMRLRPEYDPTIAEALAEVLAHDCPGIAPEAAALRENEYLAGERTLN